MRRVRFEVGDRVSRGSERGEVVVITRKRDGQPFLMVRLLNGPRQGTREWPEKGWQLGHGWLERVCSDCDRPFLADDTEALFCPRCQAAFDRETEAMRANPSNASRFQGVVWKREERGRPRR
jgi:hypothetical protein